MAAPLWVAELIISTGTANKIRLSHHLDPDEVRQAIVCREGLQARFDYHPTYGPRLYVDIEIQGQPVLAVLFKGNHPLGDVYQLGSAYPLRRKR